MKKINFSTNRSPYLNTIEDGYKMQQNFRNSQRWELINDERGCYGKNDHNFSYSGVKIWRDIKKNTIVKEVYSTNRKGKINNITFTELAEWPEPESKPFFNRNVNAPF